MRQLERHKIWLGWGAKVCLLCLLVSCGDSSDALSGTSVLVAENIQISVLPIAALDIPATRAEKIDTASLQVNYVSATTTRSDISKTTTEKEIKTAYVVQFDGTSPTSKAVWVSGDVAAQLNSGSQIPCYFELASGVKSRVYVVANPTKKPTLSIALQSFETVTYTVSTLPGTGLPMAASQDVALGETFGTFHLKSPLARLTFTTNTGSLILRGIPSSYSLVPATAGAAAVRPSGVIYNNSTSLTSGTTYYVPANLSGRVSLPSPVLRCSLFAPSNSMYVVITDNGITYNVYLGDSSDSDFNVVSNFAYTVGANVGGTDGVDLRVNTPVSIATLDGGGTANCYIATATNTWYSFNATVMGNGKSTSGYTGAGAPSGADCPDITPVVLNPASAEVVWETLNTASAPAKGSVVKAAYSLNGRLLFRTGSYEGNAVVAIRNSSKTILWSWHIWRTNFNPASTTRSLAAISSLAGAGSIVMMDRNLGALSAASNNSLSAGFLYQWGRKDPFPAFAGVVPNAAGMVTYPGGIPVIPGSVAPQTVAYAIANPTTFITNGGDWCNQRTDNLWGTPLRRDLSLVTINNGIAGYNYNANNGTKSIYDPCPVSWRVPPGFTFANANKSNVGWYSYGRDFKAITTNTSLSFPIPAAGFRHYSTGGLGFIGEAGRYWTSASQANNLEHGNYLNFHSSDLSPANNAYRAYGYSVRCVKE